MVDLVKIRKKARERKEAAEAGESAVDRKGASEAEKSRAVKASPPSRSKESRKTKGKPAGRRRKGKKATAREEAAVSHADREVAGARSDDSGAAETKLSRFKRTAGIAEVQAGGEQEARVETTEDLVELITFSLAGEQYAMDVGRLVEIIVPRPSTRVPNADASVIGILSLRGTIVTLLDLRRILGHPARGKTSDDTRIIVVQRDHEQVGFIVDRVLRVVKIGRKQIEPHPVVSVAEQNEAVQGVFLSGETITIYLDLDRIAD